MTGTGKTRLMVGLFNTADGLKLGLAALSEAHLSPGQVKVIAQAHALNGALCEWLRHGEATGFSAWIVCTPSAELTPWTIATAAGCPDRSAERDAHSLLHIQQPPRRNALHLGQHLQAGGALLLVEPLTDAEELAAGTALLAYASGGVQTHEISRSG